MTLGGEEKRTEEKRVDTGFARRSFSPEPARVPEDRRSPVRKAANKLEERIRSSDNIATNYNTRIPE